MAPESARLAVDLSGSVVRVLEGALGQAMRCGTASVPDGALKGGRVTNPQGVAQALRQVLARNEMTVTRAFVAFTDAAATFRVLDLPGNTTDKQVTAAVARDLALDPERFASRWSDVGSTPEKRVVYAVAWDRATMQGVTEAVRSARLEPVAVELKSAAIARAVVEPTCIILDLASDPAEIVLIDDGIPMQSHAIDLTATKAEDIPEALAEPVRSVIRFHQRNRHSAFDSKAPVLVSTEQMLPAPVLTELADLLGHPVREMNSPPRVPANIRHSTYLTCLGLIMRRGS